MAVLIDADLLEYSFVLGSDHLVLQSLYLRVHLRALMRCVRDLTLEPVVRLHALLLEPELLAGYLALEVLGALLEFRGREQPKTTDAL